ncbi:Hypothetical predicted protein [Paramuricea clavata]|uniref:Uncharacterized protein n=1 Tax=Paramuricea clavata TaxID=317549 RepID=A0A6S7FN18_PARCT|nr:Hypothetical predicted protein [Paramuricea clavata]
MSGKHENLTKMKTFPKSERQFKSPELKDQTLPSNDNQFGNEKERINVKLHDRNVEQNSNPNPSSNQNKHDFLSSPVKVCRKEQKRPSNTSNSRQMKVDCTNSPAKKCKHEAVRVPMPSTE